MHSNKRALLKSGLALLLCVSMLVSTTFAWFTDVVESGKNIIAAGNLDVELYHSNAAVTDERVKANTELFLDLQGNPILWEPGVVSYENLRVANEGSLALVYQLAINVAGENYILDNGAQYGLSQVLKVGVVKGGITATDRDGVVSSVAAADWMALSTFVREGALQADADETWGIVIYWQPGDNDNNWNANNGKQLSSGDKLSIELGIHLIATQMTHENDSFGNDYDDNAIADFFPGFQGGSAGVAVVLDDQGMTTADAAMDGGDVSAIIPAGVQVANGTNSLGLTVALKNSSDSNVQVGENEEMRSLDVHIEGVAEGNTVPMLITLKQYLTTGINTGALRLYHVENGVTVPMTQVATPVNHNEFSYDPATGDVTLALASFSEVAVVADTNNTWNGNEATNFARGSGTETDPYIIANADQLAYFRTQVDKGNSFEGKFVKLENNIYLSNQLFDPIGWGYVNASHNRDVDGDGEGDPGKVFQGTFDGNGKTIFDLYQNGWDLEEKTGTDYTYTNCGFGLFAAASNATFKNLTINGAYVRVECVEAGVLVGLSQNGCTYENINIHNAKIANYQRPAGGLIGEVSGEGTTTITNVTIGSDVVVGSLWGDFDAPCGGVIGAYWNDIGANPQIEMTNVEVGARMDVYSDVTSAYQWYAYRRAGMLIGNTDYSEKNENGTNIASTKINGTNYLTCSNVKVYYGDWAAYHYCQFTNQDNDWCNNYPWVRVEAGENCDPYSNPRYGQPVVGGVTVSTDNHTCTGEHLMERRFNQLYGGGQGVYGQFEHEGVEVINYSYSITYVNDYQVLAIKYVTESGAVKTANDVAENLVCEWADVNIGKDKYKFGGWMNAGSTKLESIDKDNTNNIVLYPWFNDPYTARFVDQNGNVVAYCFFHDGDGGLDNLEATRLEAEAALPDLGEDLEFDYWEVQITDNEGNVTNKVKYSEATFDKYENDVTIYPVYLFKGDVNLVPVDTNSDGIIDHYQVAGYSNPNGQAMVEIPASVNGKPILQINQNAFSSYDGVHSIVVPNGVTIQKNAFTEGSRLGSGEEITIYFEGTKAQWNALDKKTGWDYGIGNNSRVFFLKDGKVDTTQGYLQVGSRKWNEKTDFASVKEQYSGYCDCKEGTGGDDGHIYVRVNADGTETIMQHNANGTPVNEQGVEIYWGVIKEGWLGSLGEEKGLRDDDTNDTYKRYRPDAIYWEGV